MLRKQDILKISQIFYEVDYGESHVKMLHYRRSSSENVPLLLEQLPFRKSVSRSLLTQPPSTCSNPTMHTREKSICSKLKIRHPNEVNDVNDVLVVKFELISHIVLVFSLLT